MDDPEYKVHFLGDDNWEVVKVTYYQDYDSEFEERDTEYQGSLSDCEAWIRLKEGGYLL